MLGLTPFNWNGVQRRNNRGMLNFYDIIDDFFNDDFMLGRGLNRNSFKIDVIDDEQEYLIEAELPGVAKDEIQLDYSEDGLSILVKREENIDDEKDNYIHRERRNSSMQRNVYLKDINANEIQAKLEDGILKIKVPKLEVKEKKYQIEIE